MNSSLLTSVLKFSHWQKRDNDSNLTLQWDFLNYKVQHTLFVTCMIVITPTAFFISRDHQVEIPQFCLDFWNKIEAANQREEIPTDCWVILQDRKKETWKTSCHLKKSGREQWGAGQGEREEGPRVAMAMTSCFTMTPLPWPPENPPQRGNFMFQWTPYRAREVAKN